MEIFEKIYFALRRPSKLFSDIGVEDIKESLIFYFTLLVFLSAMYAIMTFIFLNIGITQIPELVGRQNLQELLINYCLQIFLIFLIVGGFGIFIYAAWLHIWIYIFKGREGYFETMKSTIYSLTPVLLFGWIPIANIIAWIWYFILQIFSLSELHRIPASHVFLAYIISLVPIFLALFFLTA